MRAFFDRELDTVATIWRIYRRDGVAFGFTSHDRDLMLDGVLHQSAPGMVPAAIRLTADLTDDDAEVAGVLSHGHIREADILAGLFDDAEIQVGAVDWKTLEASILYHGRVGQIKDNGASFSADLASTKDVLQLDLVPRTSPTCRAEFCGPQCGLTAERFTRTTALTAIDYDANTVQFNVQNKDDYLDGRLRFLDGPQTGVTFGIVSTVAESFFLDRPLAEGTAVGTKAEITEGCDHTHSTCLNRFDNLTNFRGEPNLPGNDLLTRYG